MGDKLNKLEVDMKPIVNSNIREVRISGLFLQTQKFLIENKISEEERKSLARMLNAYYNG
ncbi:hypothetical protein [Mammaliicoccus sciuri]|uniref:hypothetical protein n=1 Tax=Mammaliicoccus sciuri TaxID=1296 RepID=UPI001FB3F762|nr:hypothetical protein [Mammaliicoccus sciuri]MCJ1785226.1 hypothetical protein [Mammaliicoccus sciuri]